MARTPPIDAPTSERAPIRIGGTFADTEGVDAREQFDRIDREAVSATEPMPARIGRFVVVAPLGAGGMGIVYVAYDPDLDRRVAIKLWRRDVGRKAGQHDALLVEARAMARLAHPNVVGVHEVGVHDERVFLAMEYVRGQTLRAWLAREHRDWRTIVRVFLDAGRGLVAVHEAGLIHRDFKPDNVMVRDDGRVQVMDFGIADQTDATTEEREPSPAPIGRIVGTPAFMSPEQFRGSDLDARTDQFSFCVALFGALTGVAPFQATNVVGLFEAVDTGSIAPVPRGTPAPTRVIDVVIRGLSPQPDDRWPDMATLLAKLSALVDPPRRRRWIAAGAFVVGGGVAIASVHPDACDDGEDAMARTWSKPIAARLGAGFDEAAPGYGAGAWAAIEPELDRVANAMIAEGARACTVANTATRSLQQVCLDDQRMVLASLLDELARADEAAVRNAARAVAELEEPSACADARALLRRVPLPEDPTTRAQVEVAQRELARVEHMLELGDYDDGLAAAHVLVADATAIGFTPLLARALLVRGQHENAGGDLDRAEQSYRDAYAQARRAGDDETAFASARALGSALGVGQRRFDLGRSWLDVAATEAELSGQPESARLLAATEGDLLYAQGRYAEATALLESLLTEALAVDARPAEVVVIRHALATALGGVGRHQDALLHLQDELAFATASRGDAHPDVADAWMGIGSTQGALHMGADAIASYRRALAIREHALGDRHPSVANALGNIAAEQIEQGQPDEARRACERALDILGASLGPLHPDNAACLNVLALVHWERDWAAARGYLLRAADVSRAALGDHPTVAAILNNLAAAEEKLGDPDSAIAHFREAIVIRETAVGKNDPELAYPLRGLGATLLGTGKIAEARAVLRRAVALFESAERPDAGDHGATVWSLAQAMAAAPEEPEQARVLAEQALVLLEKDDQSPLLETAAQVRAWLDTHPR